MTNDVAAGGLHGHRAARVRNGHVVVRVVVVAFTLVHIMLFGVLYRMYRSTYIPVCTVVGMYVRTSS